MEENGDDVFANREQTIPLLTVADSDDNASTSEVEPDGKRNRLKKALGAPNIRDKLQDMSNRQEEKLGASSSPSLHERLLTK